MWSPFNGAIVVCIVTILAIVDNGAIVVRTDVAFIIVGGVVGGCIVAAFAVAVSVCVVVVVGI